MIKGAMISVVRLRPGRGAPALALAAVLVGALALSAQTASASSGSLGLPPMSEAELREVETDILGPDHAAEHAQERVLASQQEEAGIASTATPSAASTGAEAGIAATGPPARVGRWGSPFPIPIIGITAVMLPTGKLMWWSYPNGDFSQNYAQAWLYDYRTGATKRVDPPINPTTGLPGNIWCSGQSLLADGRVLVTGGNLDYVDFKGLNRVYTFNPYNETWTEQPNMAHGRWYPTQVLQPDGRTVIMSGDEETGATTPAGNRVINTDIELFTPSPNMNGRGTLTKIAQADQSGAGPGPPARQIYPRMHLMRSGRTMIGGPDNGDTWAFNQVGPAPGNAFNWGERADFSDARIWETSVLEPGGPAGSSQMTIIGGTGFEDINPNALSQPRNTTETFNDEAPGLGWQPGPFLNIGRSHHNTVLLPDGSKVTVGGGLGSGSPPAGQFAFDPSQRQVELFDPKTNRWRLGAAQVEGRAYHSTAVLLPDGRVISAGDDRNGGQDRDTAEIFEPPYLFIKGKRPRIQKAPKKTIWKDKFGIKTKSKNVKRAVLVAPGATTHGVDMNQRHVKLKVIKRIKGQGINVKAPPTRNVAPPGYYMLFLLNGKGEPSVARFIQVGTGKAKKTKLIGEGKKGGKKGK